MILRFILHFEWHRGYNHNLPRISIKRAPYPGQVVYDKGWGWRKLIMCQPCSGVGYFDGPLSEIERRDLSGGPYYSTDEMLAEVEQNHPATFADSIDDNDVDFAEGRMTFEEFNRRVLEALDRTPDGTVEGVFRGSSSPLTAQDEGTGSVYHYMPAPALQDRWGRYPDDEHYECPHSQVHDAMCRPVPGDNGDRWENEGGSYRG